MSFLSCGYSTLGCLTRQTDLYLLGSIALGYLMAQNTATVTWEFPATDRKLWPERAADIAGHVTRYALP
jgi:hypothetical protein